jgi:DNA-binding CsgD family transcriptional regulator
MEERMNKVINEIEIEDLTPDLRLIAELIGLENVRNLIDNLSGINIYIPKISRLGSFIARYVKSNKSKSIKQIARELTVSEQLVKKHYY